MRSHLFARIALGLALGAGLASCSPSTQHEQCLAAAEHLVTLLRPEMEEQLGEFPEEQQAAAREMMEYRLRPEVFGQELGCGPTPEQLRCLAQAKSLQTAEECTPSPPVAARGPGPGTPPGAGRARPPIPVPTMPGADGTIPGTAPPGFSGQPAIPGGLPGSPSGPGRNVPGAPPGGAQGMPPHPARPELPAIPGAGGPPGTAR